MTMFQIQSFQAIDVGLLRRLLEHKAGVNVIETADVDVDDVMLSSPKTGRKRPAVASFSTSSPPSKRLRNDHPLPGVVDPLNVLNHTIVVHPFRTESWNGGDNAEVELLHSFLEKTKGKDYAGDPSFVADVDLVQDKKTGAILVCLPENAENFARDRILVLPQLSRLPAPVRPEDIGIPQIHRRELDNWLHAAVHLSRTNGSVDVTSSLRIQKTVPSNGEDHTAGLPFYLLLDVSVSFKASFFDSTDSFLDARRLLLYTVFPPHAGNNDAVSRVKSRTNIEYAGETSAGFFYECLRAAPRGDIEASVLSALKAREAEADKMDWEEAGAEKKGKEKEEEEEEDLPVLRPPGLVPTLLPFQSRTVRWLLWREGQKPRDLADEVGHHSVEPISREALRELVRGPLWEKVCDARDGLWVNRLASRLCWGDPAEFILHENEWNNLFEIGGEGVC
jgi:hypothetical protein